jgi:UDP-N-acetylglucosamine enolpyruvyl transferase
MAIKTSTGLRNALLDTGSLKSTFNLGFLKIYAGTVPADADASLGSATLLCTVSVNSTGTGITFAASASGGTIVKNSGEVWSGVNVATGTASFYRLVTAGDTGGASTTEARIQGTVATSGADLNLTSTSLTASATQTIDYYSLSLPTA